MQRPSYKPPSILILTVALLGACQLWAPRAGAAPDPNVAKTAERGWISREYHRIRNHLVLSETHRLVASGELENARHKLETHLRDQPRDIPARRQYLTVLDRLGLHPKVIQEATLLIDQDPEFRDARLYRAGAYQAVGRIREAVSDFQAVGIDQANEQADRIYALNMAADLALGQQLYSEALDSLAHLAAFSQTYAVYFRRGLALEGAGRVSSATEAYKLALERASTDEERLGALRGLGGTARKSGDSGAAYKVFSKAHQLRSDDVFVLRSLAEITRSQKQFRETAGWARQVLAITQDPSDREFLASVLYQSKDYSGAAREYSILKADVDPPRRVRAYRALANIAGRQGNFSSEKRHLMSALSLDSRNAEVLRALAHNSSKQRDYEASVNWIKKARAAQPKLEDHILLANGLIELGRFQDAVKQWTIVLSGLKVPRNRHPILVSLGHTHTLAGDQASATAAFREAARIRPDVLTLTALAHSLEAAQSLSEAIEIWEAVLEQSPSPETHYRLGVLFAQAGEDLQALNHLSKAAQNGLSIELKASAYKQLGYLYQKSGQLRQALSAFEKAVTRDEKDSVLYLALGNLSMQMHEYGKAIHYFQLGLAIEHTPELIRGLTVAEVQASGELLQDADSHTKPALLKQAAERFLAAYEESDDADLLAQTAQAYYLAGDWPEASKTYERLMALPGLAQNTLGLALENLGFIALREGRSDQAVDFLSQAIKQGGAGSRLRQNLGLALYSERRWREALEQFHAASEEKKDSQVLIYVARCYKELNKPGLAIKFFREALAIGKSMQPSERREVLSELGYLYAGQPDYAEAASAWRQVLVLKEEPAVRIRLARVERLASEIENAQTTLETIEVGSLPSELIAEYFEERAELAYAGGQTAQAVEHLESSASLAPEPGRLLRLGLLYDEIDEIDRSIEVLENARQLDPQSTRIAEALGYAYARRDELDRATEVFEEVADRDPHNSNVTRDLAYLLMKHGRNEQARTWFRHSIDYQPQPPEATRDLHPDEIEENFRVRKEISKLGNRVDLIPYFSYSSADRSQPAAFAAVGGTAIPSQGGVELAYTPRRFGLRNDRVFQVFGRVLGNLQPASLSMDNESYQGGIGARYKPLPTQNLYFSGERLFKIGSNSFNTWFLRSHYSWASEYGVKPLRKAWNHTMFYGDIGYLTSPDLFTMYGEARQGVTFRFGDGFLVTPHALVAGRNYNPNRNVSSYLEGGAGVAFKVLYNDSLYDVHRSGFEVAVQYRWGIISALAPLLNQPRFGGLVISTMLQF